MDGVDQPTLELRKRTISREDQKRSQSPSIVSTNTVNQQQIALTHTLTPQASAIICESNPGCKDQANVLEDKSLLSNINQPYNLEKTNEKSENNISENSITKNSKKSWG